MYITILGRQPALGIAELERVYGAESVRWFSDSSAIVENDNFDFERVAGSQKAGRIVSELRGDWRKVSMKLVNAYAHAWQDHEGKITLGISAYGFDVSPRDVQKTGIILKKKLKEASVSLRLIPNTDASLSTATSHHNKLGLSDNHVELLVVKAGNGNVVIAESVGSQNITALAARDQGRPKRDAFVGMLPPKLAKMMVNLTGISSGRVLDPFCGTGVLLQEAMLLNIDAYGSDLSEKMVDFSTQNLEWLAASHKTTASFVVEHGDAMTATWKPPITAIACETYLGQPFSAPPSPSKLEEVRGNCNHIISSFLKNIAPQLAPGTPLCVAVPAWRAADGYTTHLPLINQVESLGYSEVELKNVKKSQLLYYREDQVVARELLLLVKK
jgi:tRNA G10  N-methylase Trm11